MAWTNFHTHSQFCGGSGKPEAFVLQAIQSGMTGLGLSCLAPLPFKNAIAADEQSFEAHFREIRRLRLIP